MERAQRLMDERMDVEPPRRPERRALQPEFDRARTQRWRHVVINGVLEWHLYEMESREGVAAYPVQLK